MFQSVGLRPRARGRRGDACGRRSRARPRSEVLDHVAHRVEPGAADRARPRGRSAPGRARAGWRPRRRRGRATEPSSQPRTRAVRDSPPPIICHRRADGSAPPRRSPTVAWASPKSSAYTGVCTRSYSSTSIAARVAGRRQRIRPGRRRSRAPARPRHPEALDRRHGQVAVEVMAVDGVDVVAHPEPRVGEADLAAPAARGAPRRRGPRARPSARAPAAPAVGERAALEPGLDQVVVVVAGDDHQLAARRAPRRARRSRARRPRAPRPAADRAARARRRAGPAGRRPRAPRAARSRNASRRSRSAPLPRPRWRSETIAVRTAPSSQPPRRASARHPDPAPVAVPTAPRRATIARPMTAARRSAPATSGAAAARPRCSARRAARRRERVASATGIDDALETATEEAIVRALESPAVERAIVRVLESDAAQDAFERTLSSPAVERAAVKVLDSRARRSCLGPSARLRRGPEAGRADRRGAGAARRRSPPRASACCATSAARCGDFAQRLDDGLERLVRRLIGRPRAEEPRDVGLITRAARDGDRRRDPQRDLPATAALLGLVALARRRRRRGLDRRVRLRARRLGPLRLRCTC